MSKSILTTAASIPVCLIAAAGTNVETGEYDNPIEHVGTAHEAIATATFCGNETHHLAIVVSAIVYTTLLI